MAAMISAMTPRRGALAAFLALRHATPSSGARLQSSCASTPLHQRLGSALREQRTDVAFLRHGNTGKAASDMLRQLTELGREQARESGAAFGRELLPLAPTALSSPAPRCNETLRLFLDAAGAAPEVRFVAELYDGTIQPGGSAAFAELGYAPLRDYHAAGHRETFEAYAASAAEAIEAAVRESRDDTLLVCAHAVYIPSAALFVAEALGASRAGVDAILDCNTQEAEGYLITHAGDVSLLTRERP